MALCLCTSQVYRCHSSGQWLQLAAVLVPMDSSVDVATVKGRKARTGQQYLDMNHMEDALTGISTIAYLDECNNHEKKQSE